MPEKNDKKCLSAYALLFDIPVVKKGCRHSKTNTTELLFLLFHSVEFTCGPQPNLIKKNCVTQKPKASFEVGIDKKLIFALNFQKF